MAMRNQTTQQVMLMVGVVAGGVALAPVTELLFQAYGIGDIMPREGMDPSHALSAPKAAMMANLSAAIFTGSMNWTLFLIGAVIATSAIFVDQRLKVSKASWRLPVLGVALGIYMPLEVTFPFVIGGLIAFLADRTLRRRASRNEKLVETNRQRGTLICAGFIAGESLIGVLLAVPFAIYKSTEVFRWIPEPLAGWTGLLGVVVSGWAVYALYQKTSASKS